MKVGLLLLTQSVADSAKPLTDVFPGQEDGGVAMGSSHERAGRLPTAETTQRAQSITGD